MFKKIWRYNFFPIYVTYKINKNYNPHFAKKKMLKHLKLQKAYSLNNLFI